MKITNAFFAQNDAPDAPLIKLCRCNNLPPKISYWLSRLLQKLDSLNAIYNNERRKIILKWCSKKEDGTPDEENRQYKLIEHIQEFNAEYQELLNIEIEIDMDMIKIPLDKIPDGVLNSYDYNSLAGLIEFIEEM